MVLLRKSMNIILLCKHPSAIHRAALRESPYLPSTSLCELIPLAAVGLVQDRAWDSSWVYQIQRKDSVSLNVASLELLNFHAIKGRILCLGY